ncbi:MAG: BrnT family toxin [Patescibacteria group bacterium]
MTNNIFSLDDFRIIPGTTRIDYDPAKEDQNVEKHGYSLASAVRILQAATLFQMPFITIGRTMEDGEVRHIHLAEYEGRLLQFVTTMRKDETVRVISLRCASRKERKIYDQNHPSYII